MTLCEDEDPALPPAVVVEIRFERHRDEVDAVTAFEAAGHGDLHEDRNLRDVGGGGEAQPVEAREHAEVALDALCDLSAQAVECLEQLAVTGTPGSQHLGAHHRPVNLVN